MTKKQAYLTFARRTQTYAPKDYPGSQSQRQAAANAAYYEREMRLQRRRKPKTAGRESDKNNRLA